MATRKSLTFAAAAVLLLAGLAGFGVWWLTREAPPAAAPPVAALPAPAAEPIPAPVALPVLPPDPGPPGVVPRPTAADPKPVRTTNLANMGVGRFTGVPSDVFGALRPLGQRVARCVSPTPRAVAGPPHTVTLTMKTLDGKIRVVGAVAPRGTPDHEEVTRCARAELVGQEVESVDAVAGRTYKMPYPLPR
ncbi:MAG: hypothetical protein QM704_01270 [Anaeromyxobacteraceae bacterium]